MRRRRRRTTLMKKNEQQLTVEAEMKKSSKMMLMKWHLLMHEMSWDSDGMRRQKRQAGQLLPS
jgi:hypothetical protein